MTVPAPDTARLADLLPLSPAPRLPAAMAPRQLRAWLERWHLHGVLAESALPCPEGGLAWLRDDTGRVALQPVAVLDAALPLAAAPAGPFGLKAQAGPVLLAEHDLNVAPAELAAQVWQGLTAQQRALLRGVQAQLAAGGAGTLALVGGAVRDLLLGLETGQASPLVDLDLLVVGQAVEPLFRRLQAASVGGSYHPQYGNATLTLGAHSLDLVSARIEWYPQPGAAPIVQPATLAQDLWRRDFSLNALALVVSAEGVRLHDPTAGLADLSARVLRPLHPRSLHEDASRLVRGARLAARLGLAAHPDLLAQVGAALQVAGQTPRLWAELRLALAEPRPGQVLRVLGSWGAAALLPTGAARLLERLDSLSPRPPGGVYAAALLSLAAKPAALAEQLGLGLRPLALLERVRGDKVYAPGSPESVLRQLLYPTSYPPLTGRDLLALGFAAGPELGQVLAHLAQLRRQGQLGSADEERRAAQLWQATRGAAH